MTNQPATEFPVPNDLEGFWVWDKLHCPRPLAPLDQELIVSRWVDGFNRSMSELDAVIDCVIRYFNYYPYLSLPVKDFGNRSQDEVLQSCLVKVDEHMRTMGDRWENEWLPEMLPALEKARTTDWSTLSDAEILSRLEEMAEDVTDRWAVHGKINYAFYAAGQFGDFYNQHIQPDDPTEAYEALQGFPSSALESSRALWRLSRTVKNNGELRNLFDTVPPEQLLDRLNESDAGRQFRQELDAYLEEFGWRSDTTAELTKPSWLEDPSIALNAIQGYLSLNEDSSPDAGFESSVKRREELLANARAKLANDPETLARFNELYEIASCFTPIAEDHNHYIDQMGDISLRYPALELGRRLADRGLLDDPEHVFMLYTAELKEAVNGTNHAELARQRKQEIEHWAQVVPPPVLGEPQPPTGDPVEDLLLRFFGTPVEPSADPSVISGIGASPGTARGTAKVVRDLSEASKLNAGDILVCEMTLPPWTPLFSTVSAVVADTGGLLSHCAIVAREYRIPCVVGTAVGTNAIKDGQTITVDGSKGLVRIED